MPFDRAEIERLYQAFGPVVYRRALQILRDPEDAKEVMQEVFVTAITKGHSFRGASASTTWLYSVTTRRCLNQLRSSKRRVAWQRAAAPQSLVSGSAHPEIVATLAGLLESLPEELAMVAVHYYYDDMSQDEIAKILGCSRRQVGYLLEKLHARLAAKEASA